MANRVEPILIKPLLDEFQRERFVTIASVDCEAGGPNVSAISWIYAKDECTLIFAAEYHSRLIQNIQANEQVVVTVIANESTYSISAKAELLVEKVESLPLKLALVKLNVNEVRDVMFYGSKIIVEPQYGKTYDLEAAKRLDEQVMAVMKKA